MCISWVKVPQSSPWFLLVDAASSAFFHQKTPSTGPAPRDSACSSRKLQMEGAVPTSSACSARLWQGLGNKILGYARMTDKFVEWADIPTTVGNIFLFLGQISNLLGGWVDICWRHKQSSATRMIIQSLGVVLKMNEHDPSLNIFWDKHLAKHRKQNCWDSSRNTSNLPSAATSLVNQGAKRSYWKISSTTVYMGVSTVMGIPQ